MVDAYISWTCHGRVNINLLRPSPQALELPYLPLQTSATNPTAMDTFTSLDFTSQCPTTSRSEEVQTPADYESNGIVTSNGCVIA